ncbi:hypothetical protein BRAS3843_1720037 [Bradyrhizobium sp. STM 3843]|nr:hypothetical protein BRAS3843_1720037 [Bradyrhizobium sp. STM 3843]
MLAREPTRQLFHDKNPSFRGVASCHLSRSISLEPIVAPSYGMFYETPPERCPVRCGPRHCWHVSPRRS